MEPPASRHPCIGIFPALPLARTLDLGEWFVGTPPPEVPWRSPRFRELVSRLLTSWDDRDFGTGALLWHRERGFDGTPPTPEQIAAIRAAVTFSVLDANRLRGSALTGRNLATTENAALYVQPIDEKDGYITLLHDGALKSVSVGGWKIGERSLPLPDAVMPVSAPVTASRNLARAVYDLHMSASTIERQRACIAIEWHSAAMANPRAVTHQQRLIALNTGFEALLGESEHWKCAQALRRLFETSTAAHRDALPWAGILWSPRERTDLVRQYRTRRGGPPRTGVRSELEDWFMLLADARNEIIHEGHLSITEYAAPPERPLSRYAGKLFWKGERLLREAVKAVLGPEVLLCRLLAQLAAMEPLYQQVHASLASCPAAARHQDDSTSHVTGRASRSLRVLLDELEADAANRVQLRRATGTASASPEAASAMARAVEDMWVAVAGRRSLLITRRERDLLEGSGAEEEIAEDDFAPCD